MSLTHYTVACRAFLESKFPAPDRSGPGTDASAIHGRLGAQVALLQSPILPTANLPYTKRRNFRGLPVDKPHTRVSRLHFWRSGFADCRCKSGDFGRRFLSR